MELRVLELYRCSAFELEAGATTLGRDIPEETKKQLLSIHPYWFELLTEAEIKAIKNAPPPAPVAAEPEEVAVFDPFNPAPSDVMKIEDAFKDLDDITTKEDRLKIKTPDVITTKKRK